MKHYLYAIGAILCWASLPAATGAGLEGFTTIELMFYSFVSGAVYLYLQSIVLTRSFVLSFPGVRVSLLGVWGIFIYHFLYYISLSYAPLAEAAILATTWSFWIVFFSSIMIFKRLKLSILAMAAVGMFGAAMVIVSDKELIFSGDYMIGYMLALLCGLIWSSFSVAIGYLKVEKDPMTAFTVYAALLSTLLFIFSGPHDVPGWRPLLSAIYLGCVPLGLSFFLWNRALTGGNMVVIGFLSYLTPPLAVFLVAIVHNQTVSPQVIFGMFLIIGASIGGKFFLEKK